MLLLFPRDLADSNFMDPHHFISALRPSGSIVVGEPSPRYEEERDPQTSAIDRTGNSGPGRLYKRRRHYISKKSSGAEEENDNGEEAEEASNEVDKRRNLYQLINRLQTRRVSLKRPPAPPITYTT